MNKFGSAILVFIFTISNIFNTIDTASAQVVEFDTKVDVSDIVNLEENIKEGETESTNTIEDSDTIQTNDKNTNNTNVKKEDDKIINLEIIDKKEVPVITPEKKKEEPKKEEKKEEPKKENPPVVTVPSGEGKFLSKVITTSQTTLSKYAGSTVHSITQWKYNLMEQRGIATDNEKMVYVVINNIECGREDGFCLSAGKGNVGPFQINFIHKEAFQESMRLLNNKDIEGLYKYQLAWTVERTRRGMGGVCKGTKGDSQLACLLRFHNGNNKVVRDGVRFKDVYAAKGVAFKNILLKLND